MVTPYLRGKKNPQGKPWGSSGLSAGGGHRQPGSLLLQLLLLQQLGTEVRPAAPL